MNSITFLGTGTSTGVPQLGCSCKVCTSTDPKDKRLRTSALITYRGKHILIDAGPDMRQQLMKNSIYHVDAILVTHQHYDHIGGLDDIRPLGMVNIFAEDYVVNVIKNNMPYCFGENIYPGVPKMVLNVINSEPFEIEDISVVPIRLMHGKLPIFGYRIGDISYITDVKTMADSEIAKLKGSRILVINALRKTPHISHLSLNEAIKIAEKVGAEKTFFTHASHELGLHYEVEKELPEGMFYAYDNLNVDIL